MKNWYKVFTDVNNWYQKPIKPGESGLNPHICEKMVSKKNLYKTLTCEELVPNLQTCVKLVPNYNVKNWYLTVTDGNDKGIERKIHQN